MGMGSRHVTKTEQGETEGYMGKHESRRGALTFGQAEELLSQFTCCPKLASAEIKQPQTNRTVGAGSEEKNLRQT